MSAVSRIVTDVAWRKVAASASAVNEAAITRPRGPVAAICVGPRIATAQPTRTAHGRTTPEPCIEKSTRLCAGTTAIAIARSGRRDHRSRTRRHSAKPPARIAKKPTGPSSAKPLERQRMGVSGPIPDRERHCLRHLPEPPEPDPRRRFSRPHPHRRPPVVEAQTHRFELEHVAAGHDHRGENDDQNDYCQTHGAPTTGCGQRYTRRQRETNADR